MYACGQCMPEYIHFFFFLHTGAKLRTGHIITQTQAPTSLSKHAEMAESHVSRQTCAHHSPQASLTCEPKRVQIIYWHKSSVLILMPKDAQEHTCTCVHIPFTWVHTPCSHTTVCTHSHTHVNTLLPQSGASAPILPTLNVRSYG